MKRLKLAVFVALATVALSAVFAVSASATPTKSSACSGCHSGTAVAVTASLVSNNGATAVYNVSAPTATALAVFKGTTKVDYFVGTSHQFSVPSGSTYKVYAVKGPTTGSGIGSTTFTPATDVTAPTTSSNALASYSGTASITLSPADNVGGTGVAHTYYILDGGAQTAGTSVSTSTLGGHTLEFWSADTAGNVETPHKSVSFTVNPVPDTAAPVTKSDAIPSYVGTAAITLSATDAGGSGVAHTYYILDTGTQTEGTSVTTSMAGAHTLEFWSVDASSNAESPHNSVNFEITAPVPGDVTAPVTTSDALVTYVSAATISLSATDNAGGSGVAATYYSLDGATRVLGTSVSTSVPGTHTVEFWSQDLSGNSENPHNVATFKVNAAPTVYSLTKMAPTASKLTYKRKAGKVAFTLKAKLTSPGSVAVRGTQVVLQKRKSTKASWATAYKVTSSSTGVVSKKITAKTKGVTYYRWHVVANDVHTGPNTASQKVTIK